MSFVFTDTAVTVGGHTVLLREVERAELHAVRWLLGQLVGALGLAVLLILFLSNELRLLPFAGGMVGALGLLIWGERGTNRLRLWRLGRPPLHVALPGALARWQGPVRELNQRVAAAHAQAAAEAAALLAALAPPPSADSTDGPPAPATIPDLRLAPEPVTGAAVANPSPTAP